MGVCEWASARVRARMVSLRLASAGERLMRADEAVRGNRTWCRVRLVAVPSVTVVLVHACESDAR